MKTAMVWGADGGIGRALVGQLTSDGWTVLAVTRQPSDLERLTRHVIEADVSRPHDVEQAVLAAADAVIVWARDGIANCMNQYN